MKEDPLVCPTLKKQTKVSTVKETEIEKKDLGGKETDAVSPEGFAGVPSGCCSLEGRLLKRKAHPQLQAVKFHRYLELTVMFRYRDAHPIYDFGTFIVTVSLPRPAFSSVGFLPDLFSVIIKSLNCKIILLNLLCAAVLISMRFSCGS